MPNPSGTVENLKHYQPKWKSGATHTIRVPIALSDQILSYARQLDEQNQGQDVKNNVQGSLNHLSQVIKLLEDVRDNAPRNSFGKVWRGKVTKAIELLQSWPLTNLKPPYG